MFQPGDKVILRYPERDAYPGANATVALDEGLLTKGSTYEVVEREDHNGWIIVRDNKHGYWTISYQCFESAKAKTKRNLPSWF